MKIIIPVICFFLGIFFSNAANAQTGWQWGINSTHGFGEAWPVAVDNNGNVLAEGYGCTRIGADSLYGELFVTKVDSAGNFLWATGTRNSSATEVGIATDAAGNIYALGVYQAYSSTMTIGTITLPGYYGLQAYFLWKISPTGSVIWAKEVTANNGGPTYYYGGIGVDAACNVYLTGEFNTALDTLGTFVFSNNSVTNEFDAFVAKYDSSGNPVWAKSFGGSANDFTYAMAVSAEGNVYVTGQYESDTMNISGVNLINPMYATKSMSYLAKFDSSGNLGWAKNISRVIGINGLKTDKYENLYMTGYVDSFYILANDTLTCTGLKDIFIAKYSNTGTAIWATSAGGAYTDQGYNIDVDTCGNIWVCGAMGGGALAPGLPYSITLQGHMLNTPPGDNDPAFIVEYSDTGTYITGMALGSGADDQVGIAVDNRGNLYICADYEDSTLVIANDTLRVGIAYGNPEFFYIAKYNYGSVTCVNTAGVNQVAPPSSGIILYPNPATYECTISADAPFPVNARAYLYDITGRLINSFALSGNSAVFSVAGLSPGIYECRIETAGNNIVVKKVVVMK